MSMSLEKHEQVGTESGFYDLVHFGGVFFADVLPLEDQAMQYSM